MDESVVACDPREIVERAVFFAARQARLRKAELRVLVPEGDIRSVNCSPFRLQQAIHAGIELLLEGIAEGGCIAISLTLDPAGVVVHESAIPSRATTPRPGGSPKLPRWCMPPEARCARFPRAAAWFLSSPHE